MKSYFYNSVRLMELEHLLKNIGENKVNQAIQTNQYEQSVDYNYETNTKPTFDLFKRRSMKSMSSTSIMTASASSGAMASSSSGSGAHALMTRDTFMYIMCYIKTPSISVYSKDSIPKLLSEFRKSLVSDDVSFAVKKITKAQKQELLRMFSCTEPVINVNEMILNYFSHYLKTNIYVWHGDTKTLIKSVVGSDDSFDTTLITCAGRDQYSLHSIHSNKPSVPLADVKVAVIHDKLLDRNHIETLSVTELRNIAEACRVDMYKTVDGKKTKLLKDELKARILALQ